MAKWLVWAGLTTAAGVWAGIEIAGEHPSQWAPVVVLVVTVSTSVGLARVILRVRTRHTGYAEAHRWRRPVIGLYALLLLAVMLPAMAMDAFNAVTALFFVAWMFAGPVLFAALGRSNPDRPGWPTLEAWKAIKATHD